jgi:hypothetical protein
MRKLVLLLAVVLMITACGKKEPPKEVLFKYNFQKGQELKYKLTTINEASETIKADTNASTNIYETANYTLDLKTIDVEKDSTAEFAVTVTGIDLSSKVNGKETKYNSNNQLKPEEKLPFIQYEALVNNEFRMRVNGKGEVLEVTRIDKILDKILSMQPPPKPLTTEEKATLTKSLTERAVQPLVQQLFRLMPAKKLPIDSTWHYSYPNALGQMQINNNITFKYQEVLKEDPNIAKITADMKTTLQGSKNMTEGKISAVFDDPKISGGGTILFNIEKGLLQKSDTFTNQEFRVVLTSKEQGNKKVDRKQSSKNTLIVELLK